MPKCKTCKEKFLPKYAFQKYCMAKDECIKAFSDFVKAHSKKKDRKETAEKKKSLLTHKDYLKMLQVVFNTFIRERDKNSECISCGCNMKGRKGDASHFYSVGGNASLRFDEDNVHLSCVPCNQFKHGNLLEYAERLPIRIGKVSFDQLKARRNDVNKLSIPELIELTKEYKLKLKDLKNV